MSIKSAYILFFIFLLSFIAYSIIVSPTMYYTENYQDVEKGKVVIEKINIGDKIVPINNNTPVYIKGFTVNKDMSLTLNKKIGNIILFINNQEKLSLRLIIDYYTRDKNKRIKLNINGNEISIIDVERTKQEIIIPYAFIGDNVIDIKFESIGNNDFNITSLILEGK